MEDLFVFTVATHRTGYLNALQESCEKNGLSLRIVGLGQKWEGFKTKLRLIRETLEKVESERIVMFSDAYDTIVVGTSADILTRYRRFNADVVFSSTNQSLVNKLVFGKACGANGKALDSGMFIGKAGSLKTLFESACASQGCGGDADDQKVLAGWCQKQKITLDVNETLFYAFDWPSVVMGYVNMLLRRPSAVLKANTKYYSIRNQKFTVKKTHAHPVVLHANGNANMDDILKAFELKAENIPKDYFKYSTGPLLKSLVLWILLFGVGVGAFFWLRGRK